MKDQENSSKCEAKIDSQVRSDPHIRREIAATTDEPFGVDPWQLSLRACRDPTEYGQRKRRSAYLINLAGLAYVVTMHKYANRDPLAGGTGMQGIVETLGMAGAMVLVWLATSGIKSRGLQAGSTIWFGVFGLFAFSSSFRSFSPAPSYAKGCLYLCVLTMTYLAAQSGLDRQLMRAIYIAYCATLTVGLLIGVVVPSLYPLFSIDDFSGRMTMGVFGTPFGTSGEDSALMVLLAPLAFDKVPLLTTVFLLAFNVACGSKTSTIVLIAFILLRIVITSLGEREKRSRKVVAFVATTVALTTIMIIKTLSPYHHSVPVTASPVLYGNRVNQEATGLDGRYQLWMGAVSLLPTVPLLGYGFEGDRALMLKIVPWAGHSHNVYLEMALAGGLIGFAFLLAAFVSVGGSCLRAPRGPRLHACILFLFVVIVGLTGEIFDLPSFIGMLLLSWLPYRLRGKPTVLMPMKPLQQMTGESSQECTCSPV